jgi:hypothetical protein
LYRFIAGKILLSRNLYRFIGDKNFGQKIVSLYSIFFSKILYLYRFKRYIFEYRCPPLLLYRSYIEALVNISDNCYPAWTAAYALETLSKMANLGKSS